MLNQTAVTAAIGYAGTVVFSNLSVAIGSGIAAAALVARNVGAGDMNRARGYATSALMFSLIVAAVITITINIGSGALLSLLEPMMIVFLGVVVGGMIVAMYLPIFDMVNTVK